VDFTTLPQMVVIGIMLGGIYALIALGYTMVYGVLKLINFAHGEVFMLGAYTALFVSWWLGYSPGESPTTGSIVVILAMMLAAMAVCAGIGVTIERFAYRPMRSHARIAALITAIGVSLLLQYGGQLFLPTSPPPSINSRVNPYHGSDVRFSLAGGPDKELMAQAQAIRPQLDEAERAFEAQLANERSRFQLSPEGEALRDERDTLRRDYGSLVSEAERRSVPVTVPVGQLVMFGAVIVLMLLLTYIVMYTKRGRAMRAVSLDFDSAALMGINVNTIVTFTFIIGSALAGAGAMMMATFLPGIAITTQFGVLPGVKAFVAAVFGGIGNIPGAVLGGLLLGVFEKLVEWLGYQQFNILWFRFDGPGWNVAAYQNAVAFVILIVVLLFRPGGLLGSSKVEKV
jgi:branched-chain amino acid transport system permease protein